MRTWLRAENEPGPGDLGQPRRAGTLEPQSGQGGVLRFVYDAHPATAELLDDAVVRDGLADHGIGAMLGAVQGQVNESRG
jgi:hypothetical protein